MLVSCYIPVMSDAVVDKVQYVSDQNGNVTGVFLPIDAWRELEAGLETRHLFQSEVMKQRLLEARQYDEGISLEVALEKLGVWREWIRKPGMVD